MPIYGDMALLAHGQIFFDLLLERRLWKLDQSVKYNEHPREERRTRRHFVRSKLRSAWVGVYLFFQAGCALIWW